MTSDNEPFSARDLAARVGRVAAFVAYGGSALTAADLAAIRRMDPRQPPTAFIKLAILVELPSSVAQETRWAAIVTGLAILGRHYQPGRKFGQALAESGYSEHRFSRLLRADADRLIDELPAVARYLSAKNVQTDWTDAAWLILSAGRASDESTRRSIARDYFAFLAPKDRVGHTQFSQPEPK